MLTEAWIGWMRDAAVPVARSSGGARAELGVRADGVLLRSSGLHGKVRRRAVNTNRGSVRHGAHRRREIATADGISTPGGCRSDSGAAGARVERGGPGKLHGVEAKPLQGSAGLGARRFGVATAAQGSAQQWQCGHGGCGMWRRWCGEVGAQGVRAGG